MERNPVAVGVGGAVGVGETLSGGIDSGRDRRRNAAMYRGKSKITLGKAAAWFAVVLVLVLVALWVFAPDAASLIAHVWRLLGRPAIWGRLEALAIFAALVFFLSVRLLKSGPL